MTQPLSIWRYYRNNRKKVTVIFIITFLGIFAQCALLIHTTTKFKLNKDIWPFRSFAYAFHTGENVQQSPEYQNRLRQLLEEHPAISKTVLFSYVQTRLSTVSVLIFYCRSEDINPVMNALQLTLIRGRLPAPGTHEIALHWKLAAYHGLKIGNYCNKDCQKETKFGMFIPLFTGLGDLKLVGLLDGDTIVGFSDLDAYNNDLHRSQGKESWLVIPKKGQLARAKSYLTKCIQKDEELTDSSAIYQNVDINSSTIFKVLHIFDFVITSVIALCVSCLFYIYFYQRRPEFGLLEALGHTRQMIIGKAFLEIAVLNLLGFFCGLISALLCGWALNHFILIESGLPLVLWDQSYSFRLLSTPLFVTLMSLLPVWRMLKKVDPITIIERKG
jgi:ABC-type lipoprotein release transport system permease subunit